jgi:hypothetical protein
MSAQYLHFKLVQHHLLLLTHCDCIVSSEELSAAENEQQEGEEETATSPRLSPLRWQCRKNRGSSQKETDSNRDKSTAGQKGKNRRACSRSKEE